MDVRTHEAPTPDRLEERVAQFMEQHALMPGHAPAVVGVSGGVDSVTLLYVLHRLHHPLRAVHVNYGLRGEAADRDEALVRALCARLGVPLHVARFDTAAYAAARGQSMQEAARVLRYRLFAEEARHHGLAWVAVAHHLDDQAETVLLNLFRGSGPEGLAGMPPRRVLAGGAGAGQVDLVRPFLFVRRAEIEAYARAVGLDWRSDASNASLKYRRSVIRERVLPLVEQHFGSGVAANIARAAGLTQAYLRETLQPRLARLFDEAASGRDEGGGRLALGVLRRQAPVWRRRLILEALRRWAPQVPRGHAAAEAIERLLTAQAGRRAEMGGVAVWRERDALLFLPVPAGPAAAAPAQPAEVEPGACAVLPGGLLCVEILAERPERLDAGAPLAALADADRLAFPLQVRPWQAGDRFQPLGMAGTKKVSDFLTDARVPAHRRKAVWVVTSAGAIVWVVGLRLAHPFRVRPETARIAKITYNPQEKPAPEGGAATNVA